MSSYSLILILKMGESPIIPPPPNILDITLGKFFIRSSGDVNGTESTKYKAAARGI
jgi:hypothetical protein